MRFLSVVALIAITIGCKPRGSGLLSSQKVASTSGQTLSQLCRFPGILAAAVYRPYEKYTQTEVSIITPKPDREFLSYNGACKIKGYGSGLDPTHELVNLQFGYANAQSRAPKPYVQRVDFSTRTLDGLFPRGGSILRLADMKHLKYFRLDDSANRKSLFLYNDRTVWLDQKEYVTGSKLVDVTSSQGRLVWSGSVPKTVNILDESPFAAGLRREPTGKPLRLMDHSKQLATEVQALDRRFGGYHSLLDTRLDHLIYSRDEGIFYQPKADYAGAQAGKKRSFVIRSYATNNEGFFATGGLDSEEDGTTHCRSLPSPDERVASLDQISYPLGDMCINLFAVGYETESDSFPMTRVLWEHPYTYSDFYINRSAKNQPCKYGPYPQPNELRCISERSKKEAKGQDSEYIATAGVIQTKISPPRNWKVKNQDFSMLRIASIAKAKESRGDKEFGAHYRVIVEAIQFNSLEQQWTIQTRGPQITERNIEDAITVHSIDQANLHKLKIWWGSPRHLYILHPDGELYQWQPKA